MEDIPTTSDQETGRPCAKKKKRQRQSEYDGKKKHWCPTCNQGFTRLQGLKKHLGHFLFECEVCNLIVKSKWILDRHLRSHQGVKPFQCKVPDCSRSFADKSALTKHESKTHKKLPPKSTLENGDEKYGKPNEESYPTLTQHGLQINNVMSSMLNESSLNSSNVSNPSVIEALRQLQGQYRPSTVWNLYK